ncbi:MAG: MerR family transcriptional regulator [Acidimicrobiia bacterium]|nr:MerR family transcriptional regulator [Acidimicrobiia bacterium]
MAAPQAADSRMTIDELARVGGTTARNVRAYQERGLLSPPEKVGRTGYYDEHHLERLQLITRLLERGFTLAAIGELLDAWDQGDTLGGVLGFEQALARPYALEGPTEVTGEWLTARFAADEDANPGLLDRSLDIGLLRSEPDGRLVAPSLRLLELAADLVEAGIPLEAIVDEAERLTADLDRIATRFHRLFETHVWQPFAERGTPPEELGAMAQALDRVRPVPAQVVAILLAQAMERQLPLVAGHMLDLTVPSDEQDTPAPSAGSPPDLRSA